MNTRNLLLNAAGISNSDIRVYEHQDRALQDAKAKQQLLKIATCIFEGAGDSTSPTYNLIKTATASSDPHLGFVSDAVVTALGQAELDKRAVAGMTFLNHLGTTGAVAGITGLAAVAGSGIGGLAHLLMRDSTESSEENEVLKAKIHKYKQIRRRIQEELEGRIPTESQAETLMNEANEYYE